MHNFATLPGTRRARPRSRLPVTNKERHIPFPADVQPAELARRLALHPATVYRWKARGRLPTRYGPAVAVALGALGALDPIWNGWTVRGGTLISPEGWEFRPADVLTLPLLRQQVACLRADLRPQSQRELF